MVSWRRGLHFCLTSIKVLVRSRKHIQIHLWSERFSSVKKHLPNQTCRENHYDVTSNRLKSTKTEHHRQAELFRSKNGATFYNPPVSTYLLPIQCDWAAGMCIQVERIENHCIGSLCLFIMPWSKVDNSPVVLPVKVWKPSILDGKEGP